MVAQENSELTSPPGHNKPATPAEQFPLGETREPDEKNLHNKGRHAEGWNRQGHSPAEENNTR